MIFGEGLARGRGFLEVEHRTDQALREIGGPAFRNACWQTTAASVAPAESPPTTSLVASMPSDAACCGHPSGRRDRVFDGGGKFVFGREPVVDRDETAPGRLCERRGRSGHGSRCCRRPCRRRGRTRSPARALRGIGGRIETVRNIARRAGQRSVDPVHWRHVGARELHQLGKRLTAVVGRSAATGRPARPPPSSSRRRFARGSSGISAPVHLSGHDVNHRYWRQSRKEILRNCGQSVAPLWRHRTAAAWMAIDGPDRQDPSTISQTWTFFEGEWHDGNVPIMGPRTHAAWLGSTVFDGARAFEGVAPDLDRHCARVNRSATNFGLKPRGRYRDLARARSRGHCALRAQRRTLYPADVLGAARQRRRCAVRSRNHQLVPLHL